MPAFLAPPDDPILTHAIPDGLALRAVRPPRLARARGASPAEAGVF